VGDRSHTPLRRATGWGRDGPPVTRYDAVVVGSGPNGLAASVTLARAGLAVHVVEGADRPGGGCRTDERTLPGFRHDVCSAAHPLLALSPFFADPAFDVLRADLLHPGVPFAHPLEGGAAAVAHRSLDETADALGPDGAAYLRLLGPLVAHADDLAAGVLAPLRNVPRHPATMARFGRDGLRSLGRLVGRFADEPAPALLAGVGAHGARPHSAPMTAGVALLLTAAAHAVGWPVVAGGSAGITDALLAELGRLGGSIETGRWVGRLDELPEAEVVLLDVAPAALPELVGPALPGAYRRAVGRFRHGPGVCKVDWALSGPVPWTAAACRSAGTLHLGGTAAEVAAAEADVWAGRHPDRPYCIVVQPGVADRSRAGSAGEVLWAYCHVPAGSDRDMTAAVEAQIERFAPGFGDLVLARTTVTAAGMAAYDPNYVGGDIGGGAATLLQTVSRPVPTWNPYRVPVEGVYLCSSSTPPGAGVHGMCGVYAARTVLHDRFGGPPPFAR
jgi:phytoene dehydrogenase-like protein